jgi:uncharacterized HAD superfamily protein
MTRRPVLAVDIDEVLCPFADRLFAAYNQSRGTSLSSQDMRRYHYNDAMMIEYVEAQRFVDAFHTQPERHGAPIPGAVQALEQLSQEYDIVIVTSRPPRHVEYTSAWLRRYFGGLITAVYFANYWQEDLPKSSKADLCRRLGVDVLVDDHLDYVSECAGVGIRCLLFGDYSWNRAVALPAGVRRVRDWNAAVKVLMGQHVAQTAAKN